MYNNSDRLYTMLFFNTALSELESAVHTKAKNPSSSLQVSHGVDTQPSPERGTVRHCMHSYLVPSKVQPAAVEQVVIDHTKLLLRMTPIQDLCVCH